MSAAEAMSMYVRFLVCVCVCVCVGWVWATYCDALCHANALGRVWIQTKRDEKFLRGTFFGGLSKKKVDRTVTDGSSSTSCVRKRRLFGQGVMRGKIFPQSWSEVMRGGGPFLVKTVEI